LSGPVSTRWLGRSSCDASGPEERLGEHMREGISGFEAINAHMVATSAGPTSIGRLELTLAPLVAVKSVAFGG
jgi:hypothetical protein